MYANKIFIKLLIFSFQKNSSSSSNLQRFRQNLLEFTKILANFRLNIGEKFSTLELRGSFKNLPKVTERNNLPKDFENYSDLQKVHSNPAKFSVQMFETFEDVYSKFETRIEASK